MSMTIGPAMEVGGNVVEMRTDGKVQVTNPKGKVKTLTQDEFKKQTIKNADKIASGEDFEYKKDHKGLKIAGAAAGTVAVSLGIIYRKEIGKYLKNFSFKKLWQDIKGLFKSTKNKDAKTPEQIREDKRQAKYSLIDAKKDAHRYYAKTYENEKLSTIERDDMIADATEAFRNYDDTKVLSARTKFLEDAQVSNEQLAIMQKVSKLPKGAGMSAEEKALLPEGLRTKKACSEFVEKLRKAIKDAI